MNRIIKTPAMFVALSMFAATPFLPSCSSNSDSTQASDLGDVGFRVEVIDGVNINEIQYTISRAGQDDITGVVDVSDQASFPVTFGVDGLPDGDGYTITLTAVSVEGNATCLGSADFSVVENARTAVELILSCEVDIGDGDGGVDIEVGINICPNIGSVVAAPDTALVGESISLSASASDLNADDVLNYSWSADGVEFATGENTSYLCDSPGVKLIGLSVSDGVCSDDRSVSVTCNGIGGDTTTTGADTTTTTGGDTDTAGESTTTGDESTTESSSETGDGTYWGLGEACDTCMAENCIVDVFGLDIAATCPPDDSECRDIYSCSLGDNESNTTCVDGLTGSLACYCGDVPAGDCPDSNNPNIPNGVCKAEIEASLGVDRREDVIAQYGDLSKGAGRASVTFQCLAGLCLSECLGQ